MRHVARWSGLLLAFIGLEASAAVLTQTRLLDSSSLVVGQSPLQVSGSTATRSYDLRSQVNTEFSQFDPALGNLTAVHITLEGSGTNRISVESENTLLSLGSNNLVLSTGAQTAGVANGFSQTSPADGFDNEYQATLAIPTITADLSGFVGTGGFDVQFVNDTLLQLSYGPCDSLSGFGIAFCPPDLLAADFDGNLQIEYDFVPERLNSGSWTQTRPISLAGETNRVEPGLDQGRRIYEINDSGTTRFSQFDPALGNLTGVEIRLQGNGTDAVSSTGNFSQFPSGENINTVRLAAGDDEITRLLQTLWDIPQPDLQNAYDIDLLLSLASGNFDSFIGVESIDAELDLHSRFLLALGNCVDPGGFNGICVPEILSEIGGDITLVYHYDQNLSEIPLPAGALLFGSALLLLSRLRKTGPVISRASTRR